MNKDLSHSVRILVPGAVATLAAFSANGLFAGLSGLFLASTLHHPSHALSGATLFLVFASGVVASNAPPVSCSKRRRRRIAWR
jgi:hypothetical protein